MLLQGGPALWEKHQGAFHRAPWQGERGHQRAQKKRWCNGGKMEIEWNFTGIFKEY